MFGVDTTEFLIVAVAALIFIGPKELPAAMRTVGRWVGQARAHARHFTSGIENMMREAELEEMEKRWRDENERIMREHPTGAVPYAGASEGLAEHPSALPPLTSPPSTSLGTDEDGGSRSLGTGGEGRAAAPFAQSGSDELPNDEPTLPLPEPDNRHRELP